MAETPVQQSDLQGSTSTEETVLIYRMAADQGSVDAMNALGYCYSAGVGVQRDLALSVWWYRRAAGLGNIAAMLSLSLCCRDGVGTGKNTRESVRWVRRALKGYKQSQAELVRSAE